ncbi:MAG: diguanylate cyclase [Dehalococcoidia bacterium]|nr:diguanylate cyclase [Dehalococcoidia bacterium]
MVQAFIQDLTPRKEAEELFRTFSQSAPIGVYIIQNGRFRSANPQFVLATGYTEEELIGMESLSLVLPQYREMVKEETIKALKGKRSTPVEYQVMSKSGKTMWAMETVASISYRGERAVIGSFVDITERKRMEDALQSSLDKLARNARQLLALSEASHAIQRAGSLKEIYRTVLQHISKLNYQASLYTLTEDSRHLVIAASTIRPSILKPVEKLTGMTFKGSRFPLTPGTFYEQIITGGETTLLSPYAKAVEEALPAPLRPLAGAIVQLLDLKEGIGARLNVGGKPYGMLTITGAGLTEDDRQAGSTFANHVSIAIEKTLLLQRVQEMAITDGLTGLYNHRHFHELLDMEAKRARRYKHCLSLVMSDIDHFKSVNDTFGHLMGDTVLKSVAKILTKAARETDHVARYGGEEFAIILPETSNSEAAVIAERIRRAVEDKEIVANSTSIRFTISMGAASTQVGQEGVVQDLVQKADKALYQAKHMGRNRVCSYS